MLSLRLHRGHNIGVQYDPPRNQIAHCVRRSTRGTIDSIPQRLNTSLNVDAADDREIAYHSGSTLTS